LPIIPGNQQYSPTIAQLAIQLKANPEFYNVLGGAAGYSTEPLLTICNEIMCRILAENMPWKWNRQFVPPFLTASLQQDYCTNLTNVGWLENAWRIDINNSTSNSNGAPKPCFALNTVRDIPQTSVQSVPDSICFVPNYQAFLGSWQANTVYGCGYGVSMTPRTPIQQFEDVNGNILYIDSTGLGLTIESPGYTGTTITPPGTFPYGTSGSAQPAAAPNATPGTLVADGSVVWTVADPNGVCLRLDPTPALNGLCWWIQCEYQQAPPNLLVMQSSLAPIPVSMIYLFRAGVRAQLQIFQGNKEGGQAYAEWEETLMKSVRAGDRQQEDFAIIPTSPIMSPGGWQANWAGIGAAYPFQPPYGF